MVTPFEAMTAIVEETPGSGNAMTIAQPGIYYEMAAADYFADPCPAPSLTQSVAKILLDRSALHAWHAHPRLNPNFRPDDDTKYDIGNIAHRLLLGCGKELVVLDYDDWRTKAAKEAREEAAAAGRLAVLGKHVERANAMVRAARDALDAAGCRRAFEPGKGRSEAVIAWQEPAGFWCRSMIDWLGEPPPAFVYDYKTTGMSVAPHAIGRLLADAGWDVQAAMIERGLQALRPDARYCFRFVAQEDEPPYAMTICELPESVMTMGRKKLAVALRLWQRALATGRWPGYAKLVVVPSYPDYAEAQWLDREQGEFADDSNFTGDPPPRGADLIMAG